MVSVAPVAAVAPAPQSTNDASIWVMSGEITGLCQNLGNAAQRLGTNGTGIAWFFGNRPDALTGRYLSTNFVDSLDFTADSRLPWYVAAVAYVSNETVICGPKLCITNDIVTDPRLAPMAILNPNVVPFLTVTQDPINGPEVTLTVWGVAGMAYTVEEGPDALGLMEPLSAFDGTNGPWTLTQDLVSDETNVTEKLFQVEGVK